MTQRLVSVGDDFNLPPVVNVVEENLPDRLSPGQLSATYARFVDESGNPLAGKHVVIKVDSTTGEIIDIVAEA